MDFKMAVITKLIVRPRDSEEEISWSQWAQFEMRLNEFFTQRNIFESGREYKKKFHFSHILGALRALPTGRTFLTPEGVSSLCLYGEWCCDLSEFLTTLSAY